MTPREITVPSDDPILVINPLLERSDFDSSDAARQVLCELPDPCGKMYRFTVPESLMAQLDRFDGSQSLEAIKQGLATEGPGAPHPADFDVLVREHLLPRRILVEAGAERDALPTPLLPRRPHYMLAKRPLLPPRVVNVLARPLGELFGRIPAAILVTASVAVQLAFYVVIEPGFASRGTPSAGDVIAGLLLVFGGLLAHEFGHAAAAWRQGCRQVEIGIGWYICFVVFYADLSEAWKLSRKQRVIIDCGGMYFQTIYTAILIILYGLAPSPAIFYAVLLMNFALLWNLNPFLRLDGYWMASDLLGVANLREEASRAISGLMRRWSGKELRARAFHGRLDAKVATRLLVYAALSNLFFAWMAWLIVQHLLRDAIVDLSSGWEAAYQLLVSGTDAAGVVVAVGRVFWQALTITAISLFTLGIAKRLLRWTAASRGQHK